MKTTLFLSMLTLTCSILTNGCHAQRGNLPGQQTVEAFKAQFPRARHTEWDNKQGFHVAEFYDSATECEAWFDHNGKWTLTKRELRYDMLPTAIRNSIEKSVYGNWKKDDITKIERPGVSPVYIIEVEKNDQETDLYYAENGQILKTLQDLQPDKPLSYTPLPVEIQTQITQKYPQAILIDTDREKGKYEIDILDQGITKEVLFNGTSWESTSWKVDPTAVPSVVLEALHQSSYGKYRIDDIHFMETPNHRYYHFELEQGPQEVYLSIDPNGNILK